MQPNNEKEVYFEKYCPQCVYKDMTEDDEPCCDCLEEPVNLYSHKPVKFKAKEGKITEYGYPTKIKRIKKYLYEVKYDTLDYQYANLYFHSQGDFGLNFGCSSVRNGNLYGRNYDWVYDENAEFLVRVPRIGNKYSSMGISGSIKGLTDAFVASGEPSPLYKIVPFQMLDGINEHHVVVNTNVVPKDYGSTRSVPKKKRLDTVSASMIVRYILDNFTSAKQAVEYIRDYVTVYFPKALHDLEYECHYMVADLTSTYVLEFVRNEAVVIDISNKPCMTNFFLYGVNFNADGTVYTPETQDDIHNAIGTNLITERGSGLERYNYIVSNYSTTDNVEGMRAVLEGLKYTSAYLSSEHVSNPYWYTEFVGSRGLTCGSPADDYSEVVSIADGYYQDRTREDELTWQTTHSSIYNIAEKSLYLRTQEETSDLRFTL